MSALTDASRAALAAINGTSARDPSSEGRRDLDRLWRLIALALPFAIASRGRVNHVDFWWSTAVGREIVASGQFPSVEPLFFTPVVEEFVGAQWLAHSLLYLIYAAGGLPGVILLHALVTLAVGALLLRACDLVGAPVPLAAGLTLIGCVFASIGLAERPQLFAVVPFALFALLLVSSRTGWTALVGLPLVMLFWVNVHGSFILGLALAGFAWLDRAWLIGQQSDGAGPSTRARWAAILWRLPRRLAADGEFRRRTLLGLLAALATLCSPLGYRVWEYALAIQGNEVIRSSALEWQPTSVREFYGWLAFAALFAAAVLAAWRRSRPGFVPILTFGVFSVLLLMAIRNGVWWAIVGTPFVARLVVSSIYPSAAWARPSPADALDRSEKKRLDARRFVLLNRVLAVLVLVFVVVSIPQLRPLQPGWTLPGVGAWLSVDTPAGVGEFVRGSDLAGNVFASVNWTPYLVELAAERGARYFADCRYEVHPAAVWEEYGRVARGHASWQEILDRYDVRWLVLDVKLEKDLVALARLSADWREVYVDEQGVVFRRALTANAR